MGSFQTFFLSLIAGLDNASSLNEKMFYEVSNEAYTERLSGI